MLSSATWPTIGLWLALRVLCLQAAEGLSAELRPEMVEAFNRYVQATEARIQSELMGSAGFLHIDCLAGQQRAEILASLQRGEIYMQRLETRDNSGHSLDVPHAIIHHWIGAVFIPRASVRQVLDLVQDYDRHQDIYKPEVIRSRLLSRNGNDFRVYYRLRKKKLLITVTLDTDHSVRYACVDEKHCYSRSYSTDIAEVAEADTPREHRKPVGRDSGFLWRLNSYWRFQGRDGGAYVECESVSLTRDIPPILTWIVRPFISSIPKESLLMTLDSTRRAVLTQRRQGALPAS